MVGRQPAAAPSCRADAERGHGGATPETDELVGELMLGSNGKPAEPAEATPLTLLSDAIDMFLQHVRVHSPDKPRTVKRYTAALDHVKRILGRKMFVEAITRPDIDDYKAVRSGESSDQHPDRRITPRTINYEICVLRIFFIS